MTAHISIERIEQTILLIRRHRVMLDTDLTNCTECLRKCSTKL